MDPTEAFNTNQSTVEIPTTTESTDKFKLTDYLLQNYIIIIIPSVFVCAFLIFLFIFLIRKIMNRGRFDPRMLETYSSVNYDEESIDDELGNADDLMYTSCKLLVGGDYEDTPEMTNSEPEYDCISVDVSVNPNESSIVDWDKNKIPQREGATQDAAHSLKTLLPKSFWRRS